MKILSLYFKNINSLEGESRVQFNQPPIADCGVFAITGPNGSGKSSILDVITLGLYGETFRFDRPAEYVMTKSTAESLAEVEFELGKNKYRSSWHVNRKNGNAAGELLAPEMKLTQLNGSEQILGDSTQKVREKVIELTGMDFHKFTKSMVLAQGDFAAFLNALDSERMDVLEKISGTDLYDNYKKQAEEKHAEVQTQLQQLEQDLKAIPILDAATREASEHDLVDFKEQLTELNQEQNTVEQQLSYFQTRTDLENQIDDLATEQQQEEKEQEENKKVIEQIESTQDVAVFDEELVIVDNKTEEAQQSKKALDSYRSELELLQNQLKSRHFDEKSAVSTKTLSLQQGSIDELKIKLSELNSDLPREKGVLETLNQQVEEKMETSSSIDTWLKEHEKDKKLLDNFPEIEKLKVLRKELADLSEKQQGYSKWSKNTTVQIKKKKADITALNNKVNESKAELKSNEKALEIISDGRALEELHDIRTDQQERVSDFQELLDLAGVNEKLGKKSLFSQLFSPKSASKEVKELKIEADYLQMEIGKEQNIVIVLETAIKNEMLLQKMESDRQFLVDGKPCFLCGALEHPYAKHPPAVSNSKQVLIEQQKKLKGLLADANDLSKQIGSAELQEQKDDKKDSQLQLVRSQWRSLANKLNCASVDMDDLSLIKDLLKNEKQELVNITKLLKKYTKQQKIITQSKLSIEVDEVTLKRITKEAESLGSEWENRPQESIEIEQIYSQCKTQEKTLSEKIVEQLTVLGEKLPDKGQEDILLESLTSRRQEYQKQLVRLEPLSEEIKALEAKLHNCSSKIEELNNEMLQCSNTMQQEESAGLHLSLVEKQKLIAEKEAVFSQQETELASLKTGMLEKCKSMTLGEGKTPVDLNVLKESVALVKRKPEIQQRQTEVNESLAGIVKKIDEIQLQLETEKAKNISENSEEELLTKQKSIKEKIDITQQEVETLQRNLGKQDDLQEKYQTVLAKVTNQKTLMEECEAEIKLVTDENALGFRHKVQQSMVDKLLSQSNQILEKISGRYFLRKAESEHGLALEIEDTKQKNVRRLPKTLSGGESFIVSLALALGLADVANNGHAVDSLFLDEGFGNLDEESLYLVMTTLESLKTHGKVVGVISHVEGVRKRIKTQIEMIKKPNGLSALKVTS